MVARCIILLSMVYSSLEEEKGRESAGTVPGGVLGEF